MSANLIKPKAKTAYLLYLPKIMFYMLSVSQLFIELKTLSKFGIPTLFFNKNHNNDNQIFVILKNSHVHALEIEQTKKTCIVFILCNILSVFCVFLPGSILEKRKRY